MINKVCQNIFSELNLQKGSIYSVYDSQLNQVQQQEILIRVNCLDCLDRTNDFQMRLLYKILVDLMIKLEVVKGTPSLYHDMLNTLNPLNLKKDYQHFN